MCFSELTVVPANIVMIFGGSEHKVEERSFYYYAVIGNIALFLTLYNTTDHLLRIISASYQDLPEKKRIDWRLRYNIGDEKDATPHAN